MKLWNEETDLWLLTPEELEGLPAGTILTSISGEEIAYDPGRLPDLDTRYGVIAWGLIGRTEYML